MPIYSYRECRRCGAPEFDRLYTTFAAAEVFSLGAQCDVCGGVCIRGVEVPLQAHLYGNPAGYHKPSPTKRTSTKLINRNGNGLQARGE